MDLAYLPLLQHFLCFTQLQVGHQGGWWSLRPWHVFVSDRSIKLTGKEGLLAVQIASSTAVMSCEDSHRFIKTNQETYPFPIHVSQSVDAWIWGAIWRPEEHLRCQKGLVRLASKGASKKVVLVYRSQDQLHLEPSGLQVELLANLRVRGQANKPVNILKLLTRFSLQCVRMCLDHISYTVACYLDRFGSVFCQVVVLQTWWPMQSWKKLEIWPQTIQFRSVM